MQIKFTDGYTVYHANRLACLPEEHALAMRITRVTLALQAIEASKKLLESVGINVSIEDNSQPIDLTGKNALQTRLNK